jgi:DNA-binding CsgD family transcriptional regulator
MMLSDEQLYLLIHTFPGAAHARLVETGKYFIVNQHHTTNHGFTDIDAAINITYNDLFHHRSKKIDELHGSLELEKQHRKLIETVNLQADHANKPICTDICALFPTGFIQVGVLKKIPIFGYKNKVVSIFTLFEEKTGFLDLIELYSLYKNHYPLQQAITQFLTYLNIRQYFQKLPTNQELIILLRLRQNPIAKYTARILGINYRTVEEYKTRLRNKLILVSLDSLLILLRMHGKRPLLPMHSVIGNEV